MMNLVLLQEHFTEALRSCTALESVNVVQWRKLRMQSELDLASIWMMPRNGRSGAGILVEMPELEVRTPNPAGPYAEVVLPVAVLEEPNLNFSPDTGTLLSAEDIAQTILDFAHQLPFGQFGTFYGATNAIQDAAEFENVLAYRVRLRLKYIPGQTARVATPSATETGGVVTLACTTSGAQIRYTLDGSFPGPSNAASRIYTAPFTISIGESFSTAAFAAGLNQSSVVHHTRTS